MEPSAKRGIRRERRKVQTRPRGAQEEHFILRVLNLELAERIRNVLSEESKSDESETEDSSKDVARVDRERHEFKLTFDDHKKGKLMVDGESFEVDRNRSLYRSVTLHLLQVTVAKLPTTVESFKTLDDLHCVKLSRVNQILVIGDESGVQTDEWKDGVAPPFEDARNCLFKPNPTYSAEEVSLVEQAILSISEGWAPAGWKFIDTEEQSVTEDGKLVWKAA